MDDDAALTKTYQQYLTEAASLRRKINDASSKVRNPNRIKRLRELETRLIPHAVARLSVAEPHCP